MTVDRVCVAPAQAIESAPSQSRRINRLPGRLIISKPEKSVYASVRMEVGRVVDLDAALNRGATRHPRVALKAKEAELTKKLIAIYRKPDDEAAFLKHYEEVHSPLVRSVPGLQRLVVNRVSQSLMGPDGPFMIAEMHFADDQAFADAMRSPENKAAGKDLAGFANGLVTLVVAESD